MGVAAHHDAPLVYRLEEAVGEEVIQMTRRRVRHQTAAIQLELRRHDFAEPPYDPGSQTPSQAAQDTAAECPVGTPDEVFADPGQHDSLERETADPTRQLP